MYVPTDRMITVGTANTRYWMEGEGSPVVLVHGLSNCIEDWLLNIPALAEHHRVYALDLLGHGRTDKPLDASYTFPALARFVKDFMDCLGIQRAHLVGHSLGGAISLILAQNNPGYVEKLILADSAGLARQVALVLRLISVPGLGELIGNIVFKGDLQKRIKFQRQSWPDPAVVPDEMIELKYRATLWENISKTYFKSLRANMNLFGTKKSIYAPIVRGLSALKNPLLVVWGKQDPLLPYTQAQIIQEHIPHARLELFDHCGHDPMVTHSERFNHLALEFLKD